MMKFNLNENIYIWNEKANNLGFFCPAALRTYQKYKISIVKYSNHIDTNFYLNYDEFGASGHLLAYNHQ